MTLIEMLDAIEAEIVRLRAERAKLAAALDTAQAQLRALLDEPVPPKNNRKRPKASQPVSESPADAADAPKKARLRPPRRALGKTLAQLRSAARREIV